jgi:hypothetical protein
MLAPDDPQYRQMPALAKRMLALLAYFSMTGQLTKQLLADIQALEKVMEDEKKYQVTARRVGNVIAKVNEEFTESYGLEQAKRSSNDIAPSGATHHSTAPPADRPAQAE